MVTATIEQTASRISICFETQDSRSHSTMAAFGTRPGASQDLSYVYENWPCELSPDTVSAHRGLADLRMVSTDQLTGAYRNDTQRSTEGQFELTRD